MAKKRSKKRATTKRNSSCGCHGCSKLGAPTSQGAMKDPEGHLRDRRVESPAPRTGIGDYEWMHEAAATAHGWRRHMHHEGGALRLSRADYDRALVASLGDECGRIVPHGPALSPHK